MLRIPNVLLCLILLQASPLTARAKQADSGRIAFIEKGNVYTILPNGREKKQLTRGGKDASPSWSCDGKMLAFVRQGKEGYGSGSIYTIKADGTGEREVVSDKGQQPASPVWSSATDEIAYLRRWNKTGEEHTCDVVFVSPEGAPTREPITVHRYAGICGESPNMICQWSSDGSRLTILFSVAGPWSVKVLDLKPTTSKDAAISIARQDQGWERTWGVFWYGSSPKDPNLRLLLSWTPGADKAGWKMAVVVESSNGVPQGVIDVVPWKLNEKPYAMRVGWAPDGRRIVYEKDGWIMVADYLDRTTRRLARGHSPEWCMR